MRAEEKNRRQADAIRACIFPPEHLHLAAGCATGSARPLGAHVHAGQDLASLPPLVRERCEYYNKDRFDVKVFAHGSVSFLQEIPRTKVTTLPTAIFVAVENFLVTVENFLVAVENFLPLHCEPLQAAKQSPHRPGNCFAALAMTGDRGFFMAFGRLAANFLNA
jgi:hypothetical protein